MKERAETYNALLLEYASGCLDEAHALVVAAHMALSPQARRLLSRYESIGGSMLHDCCSPVAMKADALQSVMARLDALSADNPCAEPGRCPDGYNAMPVCLQSHIETTQWTITDSGYEVIRVRTRCEAADAQLLRLGAGQRMVTRDTDLDIVILVLDGTLIEGVNIYRRGDLIVIEPHTAVEFTGDKTAGCVFALAKSKC